VRCRNRLHGEVASAIPVAVHPAGRCTLKSELPPLNTFKSTFHIVPSFRGLAAACLLKVLWRHVSPTKTSIDPHLAQTVVVLARQTGSTTVGIQDGASSTRLAQ
jgi:hypothetical protein